MWSKLNYSFVLALLFFEAVASVPYPPTYLENYKLSKPSDEYNERFYDNTNPHYEQLTTVHKVRNTNKAALIQQRDIDYLPRSLPAYMSPTPTKRESKQINNAVDEIFPRQIITNNFRTPRAVQTLIGSARTGDETQAATPVIHEINRHPTFNRETFSAIREGELPNQFLQNVQEPFLTIPFQESYQPVHDSGEHNRVPLIDAGHIAYNVPVKAEPSKLTKIQIVNYGNHEPLAVPKSKVEASKPTTTQIINYGNHEPLAVPEKHNIQELLSSQRIRDVLSTTKHRKRYLVIHSNGTVEHIDNLEPIAKNHPNYILVKSSRIVSSTFKKENVELQSPVIASTAQSKSSSINTEIAFEPQLQIEPIEHRDDIASTAQSKSISTNTEVAFESQLQIEPIEHRDAGVEYTPKIIITKPPITQPSSAQEVSVESITGTGTAPVPQASVISENVTSPEENVQITEVSPSVEVLSKEENTAISLEILNNSSAADTSATNTWDIEVPGSAQKAAATEPVANASFRQDILNEQNEQLTENFQEIIDENSSGKPAFWLNTSDPNFWNTLTNGQEDNIIYIFNINSRPRIEKDTTRTIFPDGDILEEITESIWYNENDPVPVVTKTSSIIHPDDS